MKAVILAAGVGSRLAALTGGGPKAMVSINGQPLLLHQIQALREAGLGCEDIVVVTGHAADAIRAIVPAGVRCLDNPEYAVKNNIHSFWLARQLDDDILLLNCDTFFPRALIREFLRSAPPTALAIDGEKPLADEEMKVSYAQGALREISKSLHPHDSQGEYIGLARFSREDARIIFEQAERLLSAGRTNVWYEDAIGAAAKERGLRIGRYELKQVPWTEIDTPDDLQRAQSISRLIDEYDRAYATTTTASMEGAVAVTE